MPSCLLHIFLVEHPSSVQHVLLVRNSRRLRSKWLKSPGIQYRTPSPPTASLPSWVFSEKLVVKPDQLIKRRGKAGLLGLNKTWAEAKAWIEERAGKPVNVEGVLGTLNTFIVEPFAPHPSDTEYYVCINSVREGDMILFTLTRVEWISVMSMPRQLRSRSQWMAIYQTELNSRTASSLLSLLIARTHL
ncbi:hypothetical protein Pst134EA_009458 [Puccinia striiformis f. sp. tritici]|uniref:hypothetical protein n=1 Tax=Puccinia striiformis f. sp. tritici TaxID=168172 RepID=UPI0020075559|nr:hypothetical protein Pst134EA_009458 [Puccinia striiformis f. sp. tritici]KAH9468934.1 hypothetical protein Pst134EA_009458 [Puccinia striiformis f. sp. tritici]